MQNWEETCKNDGASLACDSVICNETPDDEAEANCVNLGKALEHKQKLKFIKLQ